MALCLAPIQGNLCLAPLSDLSEEMRLRREQENVNTLKLLGKWQTADELETNKKTAVMESAEELIMFLDYLLCFIILLQ